jgi:broad specificity phosphatase PhoE
MFLDVIRHGATASTIGQWYPGDEPLAEEAHAVLAAIAFDASPYDRICVSALRRAVETARGLGLSGFTVDPRLAERGLGILRGLTPAECRARHAADFEAFSAFDADYCIPGGESRGTHLDRVLAWLEETRASGARHALAITHGGVIDFLWRLGRGAPVHGGEFNGGELLSLSRFEVDWPAVRLISFAEPLA